MPSQQLLLSWKDHNGALVSVFENLLKNKSLVDCTLAAEGQYLKAHKVVLSACSSYFELLFNQESEKNPIVILKDVKFAELESAVNFMYRGEVEVCEDRLAAFLEVADTLQIKGLGSDGKCQTTKNKPETPAKCTKTSTPSQQFPRKSTNSLNENAVENVNTAEVDLISNNESSSQIQQSRRDTSNSSQSLAVGSSFSMASTSGSGRPGSQDNMGSCSSPSSRFPSGETVPTDVNTVIKTEPVTDAYLEEKSDETERDFDDVTMMEDQEDWDEPNPESMGDDQADDTHDQDYTDAAVKSEESASENMEPLHAVDVPAPDEDWSEIVKEEAGPSTWNPQLPADLGTDTGPSAAGSADGTYWNAIKKMSQSARQHVPATSGRDFTTARTTVEMSANEERHSPRPAEEQGHMFSCKMCPEVFPEFTQYEHHLTQHALGRKFKCAECDYVTVHNYLLRKHRIVHTGDRPYQCSHCDLAFARKPTLIKHMGVHTGERPHNCPYCNYAASQRGSLKRHMRSHTGERPFKCKHCGYLATESGNLNRHMKIHTGERPFKCPHCNYSTAYKQGLERHTRKNCCKGYN